MNFNKKAPEGSFDDAEIIIIQKDNFKFWVRKNRFGTCGKFISARNTEVLLNSDIRVLIINEDENVVADNNKPSPVLKSDNEILGNKEELIKRELFLQTQVYPYI